MTTNETPELRVLRGIWQCMLRDVWSLGCSGAVSEGLRRFSETQELMPFLMAALPRWGKAFDAYLTCEGTRRDRLDFVKQTIELIGFMPWANGSFPTRLEVRALRQLAYCIYKYEVPSPDELVQQVLNRFVATENQVLDTVPAGIVSRDRRALEKALRSLDLSQVNPVHGPGAVAGHERDLDKYKWGALPPRTLEKYSFEYFVPYTHLANHLEELRSSLDDEPYARVVTVPKDSRGPRVISVEPKEYQWLQQGIMRTMVPYIERHRAFKREVLFRDQTVNRQLALQGSVDQSWATLDLSEASDRVPYQYVKEVFPDHIFPYLDAARSLGTTMPNGMVMRFKKWAPMGSAICFPVLALVCWARLKGAGLSECHIYGDDIAVLGSEAETAVDALSAIGLKVNEGKCCTTGFFRESCGMDAYKGADVTPVRIKARWSESRKNASALLSWCSYAHSFYKRGYLETAGFIAQELVRVYGELPLHAGDDGSTLNCPSIPPVITGSCKLRTRGNRYLHMKETKVLVPKPLKTSKLRNDERAYIHWLSVSPYVGLPVWSADRRPDGSLRFTVRQEPQGLPLAYSKPDGLTLVRAWRGLRVLEAGGARAPFADDEHTNPFQVGVSLPDAFGGVA